MKKIIEFLESDEHDWSIGNNANGNFIQIGEKFGYEFKSSKTQDEVRLFLQEKLKECLSGDDVSSTQFRKIEDHISLKYYSSKTGELEQSFFFISYVRYLINVLDSYNNSVESWLSAKKYIEALYSLGSGYEINDILVFEENKIISKSVNYLKDRKYNVDVREGDIYLDDDSEIRLLTAIDYRFKRIGEQSLFFIMMLLSNKYDSNAKRYFLRPEPKLVEMSQVDIPWGYLFNLSLDNVHEVNKPKKNFKMNSKLFDEAVELARHYFCIQRIQVFNKFSDTNHRYDTILPAIQRNILYDQHFSIDQISNDHVLKMVDGMFKSALLHLVDVKVDVYIDIMKWVFSQLSFEKPLKFTISDLHLELFYHERKKLETVLDSLSHDVKYINRGYLKPSDIEKRNYYERPFIKRDDDYIYVNSNFCNYGFYSSLLSLCRDKGVNGDVLGKVAEEFVENQFLMNGISYLSNKEYKIPKKIAKELGITSQKRECDYILETDDTIVLIELKRKTLTSDARAGDALTSMVDISQSLFHALSQTGYHEYILRRNGKIIFTDGTEVELKNRKIEKVALTLFGFFGLQDGIFVHQILHSLINATIEGDDESKNKKINDRIKEIRNQYSTDLFSKIYFEDRSFFSNCRFFSVPQLLEILSHSSSNEEFLMELNRTRHVTTGCKDWFKEYHYMRWLKNKQV